MFEPQDLPGRQGRVIRAVDHVLQAMAGESVLAGGWAVWRHGFTGRITQDVDIVIPANQRDEFLRVAAVSGFEPLPQPEGRWPKLLHKDTGVNVDLLPEGARPGTHARPSPTTIPHPGRMGARPGVLHYILLPYLIELKLAAGRARDEADVVELLRANPRELATIRAHLNGVHIDYARAFDLLAQRATDQQDA